MTATPSAIPRATHTYRIPELLHDIRLLDLLELSGTTVQAGQWLNLSQPTVSRRYRLLAQDFGLNRDPRSVKRCRYGSTTAMRLLRLGCRAHRLGAGVARMGADLMHHHLLEGCGWLLPVPMQFRSACEWAELVRQGVLDGALVSGLELQGANTFDGSGLRLLELGALRLALGCTQRTIQSVLVPHRGVAAGLQRALLAEVLKLKVIGNRSHTAQQWLERLGDGRYGLPLDPACCAPGAWAEGLRTVPLQADLAVPVWLLLPRGDGVPSVLARTLEHLQHHPALLHQGAG